MPQRVLLLSSDVAAAASALAQAGYEPVLAVDAASVEAALAGGEVCACIAGADAAEGVSERLAAVAPLVAVSDAPVPAAAAQVPPSVGAEAIVEALRRLLAVRPARRVLVVDDSEMAARLIAAELAGKGLEVSFAESVERATRLILKKSTRPDLILLDVNMPGVDGLHFCRFIKGNSLFRDIKVVLCSGMEAGQLREAAEASGADGFVPKDSFLSRWVLNEIERPPRP